MLRGIATLWKLDRLLLAIYLIALLVILMFPIPGSEYQLFSVGVDKWMHAALFTTWRLGRFFAMESLGGSSCGIGLCRRCICRCRRHRACSGLGRISQCRIVGSPGRPCGRNPRRREHEPNFVIPHARKTGWPPRGCPRINGRLSLCLCRRYRCRYKQYFRNCTNGRNGTWRARHHWRRWGLFKRFARRVASLMIGRPQSLTTCNMTKLFCGHLATVGLTDAGKCAAQPQSGLWSGARSRAQELRRRIQILRGLPRP